ncbi:MAG TPA: ParB/RepB/Spo0J family partition protein [Bacteroidales bacterium]|nr:ParB/RepB/Spo0J family partition protein [Bacteroidales bacterium]
MNAKKNALGRGLGALIEEANLPQEIVHAVEADSEIEVSLIDVNPYQPRKDFDEEALQELSDSIKQIGIIQPLTLRKMDNGRFQIIAGERRFRAAKMAGLKKVPAFIRIADDQGMLEMALVENIQRADLNAIEIAISYQRLMEECNLTQETLSERVGKKRATVANYLRLLNLPAEIQAGLRLDNITMGHARALLAVEDNEVKLDIFHQIINDQLSVRDVEEMVRNINNPQQVQEKITLKAPKAATSTSEDYDELRKQLSKRFNAKVDFKRNAEGDGKIIIKFRNDEELEQILSILDTK